MTVTVEEMKSYLRVDFEDDDSLIENFITAAKKQCMDILRADDEVDLLTIGTLLDMYSELQADDMPPVYTASQDDMDRF